MKNILVTGAKGQLGSELRAIVGGKDNCFFTDVEELDISDREAIVKFVKQNKIAVVVNCAAYTNVDKAEEEENIANLVNYEAVRNLAEICFENDIFLIHISTDYVFDGSKNTPYKETDTTSPLGVYGKTKRLGEKAIEKLCEEYIIVRTSWLYSSYGNNFAKKICALSAEKDDVKVVVDQVGTPTYAKDLAAFITFLIEKDMYRGKADIYHFSNEGVCSWYDFAKEIVALSGNKCDVQPCLSSEYPSKVARPNYSVLDKTKLKTDFDYKIPYWRDSLKKMFE